MDPVPALNAHGGVARLTALRRRGVSDRALRAAVSAGTIRRSARGTYALAGAAPELVTAVAMCGVVSHESAARLHGLDGWADSGRLHVTVPLGSAPVADGVQIHRCDLTQEEIEAWRPVTAPLRTLLDCGRSLPLPGAVVVFDSALRRGLVPGALLRAAAEDARGHGSNRLRRAVAHVDARSESALESVLRLLLELTGAQIRAQVLIPGVGRVDFLLDGWLAVEADGFDFHADRAAYRRDRQRSNALAEQGRVLLRFTWEDVRLRPLWVLAQVNRVRARAGRRVA